MADPPQHSHGPTAHRVVQDLTAFGNRATVQRIVWGKEQAVIKTFKPGAERFAAREREVLEAFGGRHPAIAMLLDAGPLHVIYQFSENELHLYRRPHGTFRPRRLMPLHIARAAFAAMRFLHEQGYALMDFHPGNVLYSHRSGVRLIDFEFAYRYPGSPPDFEKSYCLAGVPRDFDGDLPETYEQDRSPYNAKWFPYVGLGLSDLLSGRRLSVQVKRQVHQTHMALHLQKRWARARLARCSARLLPRATRPST